MKVRTCSRLHIGGAAQHVPRRHQGETVCLLHLRFLMRAKTTVPQTFTKGTMSQVGLNGVDNGAIRFTHVRIPRENLLDRFASVDRAGRYSSPLPSAGKRFAATLGELTGGRVGLTAGSLGVLKVRQQEFS